MEKDYSKRELDTHFQEVKDQLIEIKFQVMKTNGRVTKLENWRWMIVGGGAVIMATVIPLIIYIWNFTTK